MQCPYCDTRQTIERLNDRPDFRASCECGDFTHPWMEQAEKGLLTLAYQRDRDRVANKVADLESNTGDEVTG